MIDRAMIEAALGEVLKDQIAGAISLLWRRRRGEEDPKITADAFRNAMEDVRAIDEEARRIINEVFGT